MRRIGLSFAVRRAAPPLWQTVRFNASPSADTPADDPVVRQAKWSSDDLYERLGLYDRTADTVLIKRHYHILVKHYHPDQASAGDKKDAAEAFRRIREAYEVLSEAKNREQYDRDGKDYFSNRDNAFYSNIDPRRVAFLQLLRTSLPLFFFGCVVFMVVVGRRNRAAFQAAFFSHLLIIFAIIQIFPRVLAALILFAIHTSNLAEILSLSERASASVVVMEREDNFSVRPEGLSATALSHSEKLLTTMVFSRKDKDGNSTSTTTQFRNGGALLTVPKIPGASYQLTIYDEQRGILVLDNSFSLNS
jgi:hypothetical protein